MKGIKFNEVLKVTFMKQVGDQYTFKTVFFNSKPQRIINNLGISKALEQLKEHILNIIAEWISEGSGWIVESVNRHYLNVVKYKLMNGSSYIKLPPEECIQT